MTDQQTNGPTNGPTDRVGHREGDIPRISTRGTLNFVRGIGSSSNFVNLWEFLKKFPGQKNYSDQDKPVYDFANTGW